MIMPGLAIFSRALGQPCSSKVQQPHRTTTTIYDRQRSSDLRQRPLSTALPLDGKEMIHRSDSATNVRLRRVNLALYRYPVTDCHVYSVNHRCLSRVQEAHWFQGGDHGMGLLWRLFAPKPLKKARRTVRKTAHPVRTATRAVTPKPVKQLQRAAHPVSLAELKIEDAAVNALRGRPQHKQSRRTARPSMETPPPSKRNPDEQERPVTARRDERPAWIRDGAKIALLDGSDDLD